MRCTFPDNRRGASYCLIQPGGSAAPDLSSFSGEVIGGRNTGLHLGSLLLGANSILAIPIFDT